MLRAGRSIAESLSSGSVKDVLESVLETLQSENIGVPADNGASSKDKNVDDEQMLDEDGQVPLESLFAINVLRDCPREKLNVWRDHADKIVRQFITLKEEGADMSAVAESLRSTVLKTDSDKITGDGQILVLYDSKLSGEASSHPHLRPPPFRAQHLRKCFGGFFAHADNEDELPEKCVFLVLDGGRHGLDNQINQAFVRPGPQQP